MTLCWILLLSQQLLICSHHSSYQHATSSIPTFTLLIDLCCCVIYLIYNTNSKELVDYPNSTVDALVKPIKLILTI
ncbi:hypothetical protein BDB01DRAFT_798836 [Pilobolus umbonatus]|nr:hypothetical protein BDB01DRAFT_798836 [Pilobolus umbonatus]